MALQFISRDAIRAPMRFPPALQAYLDKRMAMLAADAAAIARRKAPIDEGELIAGISSAGSRVMSMAPHSLTTEFGTKKKMPKQKRRKGQPRLTREERRAAKKEWKQKNPAVPAQPFFFDAIFEAARRTSK